MKKYGYNPQLELIHQSSEDYLVGATSVPPLFLIPRELREKYLPRGENQNIGSDKMDCATRSPLNKLETDFNYAVDNHIFSKENELWLKNNGYIVDSNKIEFSDAFIAILSGTTAEGNSLIKPIDTIKEYGLIPKAMLPQVLSFDAYYNPQRISDKMMKLGNEFKKRFPIRYERAREFQFENILETELLCTGGFAWENPINGEYPRSDKTPNHAFMIYKNPKFYAFDNYTDPVDGDYIKKLSPNYDFIDIGYRVFVYKENIINEYKKESWYNKLISFLNKFI